MKTYRVFFSIYSRKMQVKVKADSGQQAKDIVKSKVVIYKAVLLDADPAGDDLIKDFFKGFKK